jgi:hypothetical protein
MSGCHREAFENVKDQIGSCGIWCGSCVLGNGALRELTTRCGEMLRAYGLKEWAPQDFDHAGFLDALDVIHRAGSCPGCRKGGGRDDCEIRACASEKGLNDCTECVDRVDCAPRELLEKMRSGAWAAGLFVRHDGEERDRALEKWLSALPRTWPSSVLFIED